MDKDTTLEHLDAMIRECALAEEAVERELTSEDGQGIPAELADLQRELVRTQVRVQTEALKTAIRAVEVLDPSDRVFDEEG